MRWREKKKKEKGREEMNEGEKRESMIVEESRGENKCDGEVTWVVRWKCKRVEIREERDCVYVRS